MSAEYGQVLLYRSIHSQHVSQVSINISADTGPTVLVATSAGSVSVVTLTDVFTTSADSVSADVLTDMSIDK